MKISKLKCFWTYPFGHIWSDFVGSTSYDRKCILCDTFSCRGVCDGPWKYDISKYVKELCDDYGYPPIRHRYLKYLKKSEDALKKKQRRLGIYE